MFIQPMSVRALPKRARVSILHRARTRTGRVRMCGAALRRVRRQRWVQQHVGHDQAPPQLGFVSSILVQPCIARQVFVVCLLPSLFHSCFLWDPSSILSFLLLSGVCLFSALSHQCVSLSVIPQLIICCHSLLSSSFP